MHSVYIIRPGKAMPQIPPRIILGVEERLDMTIVVLPGASCDIPLKVELTGAGAQVNLSGIYVCGSDEKVNISVDLVHCVGACVSRQLFKGVAGGRSRVGFYGKIKVDQDAQKTEAYQASHNLLVSDDARVDTCPQLEIYADDVKCSHGATVGRLSDEEQFYMRSRGITQREARLLQMLSFISPVLDTIADESLREDLRAILEDALRSL